MNPFSTVEVLKMPRSAFVLKKRVTGSYNYGKIYPIDIQDCIPGDTFKTDLYCQIESLPMSAPNKTPCHADFFQFFVPYRLLDENFTKFLTGNEDGTEFVYSLPKMTQITDDDASTVATGSTMVGSLWDYFGFGLPLVYSSNNFISSANKIEVDTEDYAPLAYPLWAYNLIWNLFFRDETFQEEVDITSSQVILYSCWKKDYFTASLKSQTKPGVPPALPISGSLPVTFTGTSKYTDTYNTLYGGASGNGGFDLGFSSSAFSGFQSGTIRATADASDAITFGVDDMRTVFQVQKWMERNSRCGNRYNEYLLAHYGQSNGDARLQRPEFLGKVSIPVFTTQVLQTSETATSPLGTRGANQNGVGSSRFRRFHVSEFGILITLMTIRPDAEYSQGINRQWIKNTRYDFYSGEFAFLSERPVYGCELYCGTLASSSSTTVGFNSTPFGFEEMWSEYRYLPSTYCGLLRSELNNWHMGRFFKSSPTMSNEFLQCKPDHSPYADTDPNHDCFIIETILHYKCFRPIPRHSTPGLIDHF